MVRAQWPAIESVAAALLKHGELSREEFKEIIRPWAAAAALGPWPWPQERT